MHSSIYLLLLAASLGLAIDDGQCNLLAESCLKSFTIANPNPCPNKTVLADINDACECSYAFHAVSCYSSCCPGMTQVYYASDTWNSICSGSSLSTNAAMPTSVSDVSSTSTAAAAAQSTGTDTLATVTTATTGTATGTGSGAVVSGVTTTPASGSGSGSSAGTGGSAAPASTSKAWGERSLVLPAGGVMAAVLGLAILL